MAAILEIYIFKIIFLKASICSFIKISLKCNLCVWFNQISQHTRLTLVVPWSEHYNDVIMGAMASQITSLTIVYSTVYLGADQRKHQSSASVAFVLGIHRWPMNSPYKGPVTRKMFPFHDVIVIFRENEVITWAVDTVCHQVISSHQVFQ